jgi:hypothetical protein
MKKVAILQSNYIPWKGYFDLIKSVDVFVIYDEVQYTKNDWRNQKSDQDSQRTGLDYYTMQANLISQKIFETKVTLPNWNIKHWNTIKGNYSRAAYFKEYEQVIYETYMACQSEYLSEINLAFIKTINTALGIETEIIDSRNLNLEGDKNERLIEAVTKLNGNYYLSGPAAKSYLDEKAFNDKGIEVGWMDYTNYREYNQLYPPFAHGVSVLDLIFNCGESASSYF